MKLFTFTTNAFNDDGLTSMPGFEWRGQPFKEKVFWYPWEEWRVKAWVKADNRRHAIKQIERAGVFCRDLDGGRKYL